MINKSSKLNRREFIRKSGLAASVIMLANDLAIPAVDAAKKNSLPQWRGFNILDFLSTEDYFYPRIPAQADHFHWMADWGFDFIRLPIYYPYYLKFDRSKNITPEEVYQIDEAAVERIDKVVSMAHQYNIHVCLNLHRAPGYCVNSGFYEPYNLWTDDEALKAFCFHWEMWAKRYKNISSEKISFDLVNEPSMRADMNDQYSKRSPVPGELYRKVAKAASETIRRQNPDRVVIADGNNTGSSVIPEILDLNIAQSCRGYVPGIVSHYKAPWVFKDTEHMAEPKWPGQIGDYYVSRKMLEEFYKPRLDIVDQGIGVHCGECGGWNKTPHDVFLAWFSDVLSILSERKIGFGLWEFIGDFGILDSGRTDVDYENWHGHKLDRKLLNLLLKT